MYKALVNVTLRSSILDPHGKATQHALSQLGFDAVHGVRIGKHIELSIEADTAEEAEDLARQVCEKLLANPVMEDFTIVIEHVIENLTEGNLA